MTDPKLSLRVPASPRAEASVSASARFCPRLSSLSASEFRVLRSFWLLGLLPLSNSVVSPGYPSLRLTLLVYRSLPDSCLPGLFLLPLSLRSLSVSKSLAPSKLSGPPSGSGIAGPLEGWRSPELSACVLPVPSRSCRPRPLAPGLPGPRHRRRRRRCHLRAPWRGLEF